MVNWELWIQYSGMSHIKQGITRPRTGMVFIPGALLLDITKGITVPLLLSAALAAALIATATQSSFLE